MIGSTETPGRERSLLEAGFLGFAVINAVAAFVLLAIPFFLSIFSGSFAFSDYGLGVAGLIFAAGFWGLSRLSRSMQ